MNMNPEGERGSEIPTGCLHVVDNSAYNWLYVLFNTMEEAVRANHEGGITPSLANKFHWLDEMTLQLDLREGVLFHNHEPFNADYVIRAFDEIKPWLSPHPPGTWANFPDGTTVEKVDSHTVVFHFPTPEGLALGKLRAYHFPNRSFWETIGFGYKKLGTAEGHW